MDFYTFSDSVQLKVIGRNRTYNLSQPTVLAKKFDESQLGVIIVPREFEMRLDLISNRLYGSVDYVEQLMKLNNIKNPFSIKQGDILKFIPSESMGLIQAVKDDVELRDINLQMVDTNKNNVPPSTPPSVKPKNVEQLKVNKDSKKIKIINSFKT